MRIVHVLVAAMIMFCACTTHVSAGVMKYNDLVKPGGPDLPYGETIVITGNVSDVEIDSESLGDWMAISSLTARYQANTGSEKTVQGRVDKESGNWDIVIEPLPVSAFVSISMAIEGRLSDKKADELITRMFQSNAYDQAVAAFFKKEAGKPSISDAAFLEFFKEIRTLAEKEIPVSIRNITSGAGAVPEIQLSDTERDAIRDMINLRTTAKDIQSEINDPAVNLASMSLREVYDVFTAENKEASDALKKTIEAIADKKKKSGINDKIKQYVEAYKKGADAVRGQMQRDLRAQISMSAGLTASPIAQDIQKYAGIDVGAVYAPGLDEFRQFMLLSIYYGSVDDKPVAGKGAAEYLRTRLSLTVGWDVGDISNNASSDIDGDKAYIAEIGYRLNKYFRLGAGWMLYRSKATGDLKGDPVYSLSVDLMGFNALKGLVSK